MEQNSSSPPSIPPPSTEMTDSPSTISKSASKQPSTLVPIKKKRKIKTKETVEMNKQIVEKMKQLNYIKFGCENKNCEYKGKYWSCLCQHQHSKDSRVKKHLKFTNNF